MAAVMGGPDALRARRVKAFVVLDEGATAGDELAAEIQDFVKARLAAHEYPREVEFVTALPLAATGDPHAHLVPLDRRTVVSGTQPYDLIAPPASGYR